jgi:hypothetical protein
LRQDLDRHRLTEVLGARRIFSTFHEAIAMAQEGEAGARTVHPD